ncbi:isoprenylcysteine carboxylmethyltransferase family protein [bacterium]|nr:isoprenylcysteine carboxylmethyltransferase family protein [bacterium]
MRSYFTLIQSIGGIFFKFRDLLPVPIAIGLLFKARPRFWGWVFGLPIIFLGETIRVWAIMHIGPSTRTRKISAERLVTSGPYAICRNPLYLANFLKVFGLLTIGGNLSFSIWVLVFYGVEFFTMIRYEEFYLLNRFPELFKKYCSQIPVFFPNGNLFQHSSARPPYSLREALLSEKCTFGSTGAVLVLLAVSELRSRSK